MSRQFTDDSGMEWEVYCVGASETGAGNVRFLPKEFRSGWLAFQSASEKRRLAPVPPDWTSLSDAGLALLLDDPRCARVRGSRS
jgi:hypothetical protein